ncbi:hypothetical protein [Nocardia gipuzkoensis]|uniref:hypothetical protein n=1 Tax=Nocardia gipuzkoensis TaxID=2749991 RepID=UPI003EE36F35
MAVNVTANLLAAGLIWLAASAAGFIRGGDHGFGILAVSVVIVSIIFAVGFTIIFLVDRRLPVGSRQSSAWMVALIFGLVGAVLAVLKFISGYTGVNVREGWLHFLVLIMSMLIGMGISYWLIWGRNRRQ